MSERTSTGSVRIEWPTVVIAVLCWGLYLGLLVAHDRLPWPIVVAGFALVAGWYMSLQHEVIHRHPTPWRWVNDAIGFPPLTLWLPYPIYRETHLRHHRVDLTEPGIDPESFYVSADDWDRASPFKRRLLQINRTFLGRILLGPAIGPQSLIRLELRAALRDRAKQQMWLVHVASAAVVGWVVFGVADVPVWQYLLGYVYLGMSVTYTRSFVEHLAVPDPAPRSAIVRSNAFFGVLFLFNNLHYTHHALPGAPWYRLPRLTDEMGAADLAAQGAGTYRGYAQVVRRYGVRPFSTPVTPLADQVASS